MKLISNHLCQLLYAAAELPSSEGLVVYPPGQAEQQQPSNISYQGLLFLATQNSRRIKSLPQFKHGDYVLLHFSQAIDTIVWFWSVLLAGGVPAISTPLSPDANERAKHLTHLASVLENPLLITRDELVSLFDVGQPLLPLAIEKIDQLSPSEMDYDLVESIDPSSSPTALIMLTSGSTGFSKAVPLSHEQILAAVEGKSSVKNLPYPNPYLNWIGLDHVASMVEIHIQAVFLKIGQIHVHPSEIIPNPIRLLELCSKHRVSRTFAPNSFLKRLSQELESALESNKKPQMDLSSLHFIASGGEANGVDLGAKLVPQLMEYGAPDGIIVPGFGMTETCAGAIFNTSFPKYDELKAYQHASLGSCMPGIRMRIWSGEGRIADQGSVGELQLQGPAVFSGYLNNPKATAEAITEDGWFRTGDQAILNEDNHLKLVGRIKDTLIINGVKYLPSDIESAIDNANIKGVEPSYLACFAFRRQNESTESICVTYLPTYPTEDSSSRAQTELDIISIVMSRTGCRPYVLPLTKDLLQKTSIGKISRQKLKSAFENGFLKEHEDYNKVALSAHFEASIALPTTSAEHQLLSVINTTLSIDLQGIDHSIFDIGITSIDLIRLKSTIETAFSLSDLPLSTLISNPTIRTLAASISTTTSSSSPKPYNPIVPLHTSGTKAPLWLIHPGVGEVLIFLSLASRIHDRPVLALRARGFDAGETYFSCIDDAVSTYHAAIKTRQPEGPYVLAGYSYGSMLAFEIAKRLERDGDEVRFLGSFNLPPHIKGRMKQLDWIYGLLHLSYFLGLVDEGHVHEVAPRLRAGSREEAVEHVARVMDRGRLGELKLDVEGLVKWANLSFSLQSMAKDYEPGGRVRGMDVFMATPLKAVSPDRVDWRENHLEHWRDFVDDVRFHEVEGNHYTMIAPEHVDGFWSTLSRALGDRGV